MGSDNEKATKDGTPAPADTSPVGADQRVEARRRFLRGGAGGSMLMLTVTHRRAFAGKKGTVASACTSLQGVPDLTGVKDKKALELSAMGTPKGLICRPPAPMVDPYPRSPMPAYTKTSKYFVNEGEGWKKIQVYELRDINNGLGDVDTTLNYANKARLADKGYCPIVFNNGRLEYDLTQKFSKNGGRTVLDCQPRTQPPYSLP